MASSSLSALSRESEWPAQLQSITLSYFVKPFCGKSLGGDIYVLTPPARNGGHGGRPRLSFWSTSRLKRWQSTAYSLARMSLIACTASSSTVTLICVAWPRTNWLLSKAVPATIIS